LQNTSVDLEKQHPARWSFPLFTAIIVSLLLLVYINTEDTA